MDRKQLNKIALFLFITGAVIMIIVGIKNTIRLERELAEDSRYTIGYAYKWRSLYRSGSHMYYSYQVNGLEFDNNQPCERSRRKLAGEKYFVKYYPSNPQNSILLLENPVPDWLKAPPNGWAEMPKLDMKNKRIVE